MQGFTKAIPIDTDPNLTLDSDQVAPSQKATKAYADAVLQTANSVAQFNLANALTFARRELLTAARTYYVRTDGNDANTGLVNTAGGAFLTAQRAVNVIISTLDLGGYAVTIQLGTGTYTGTVSVSSAWIGGSSVTLLGDTVTPANCVISTTSANCINVSGGGTLVVSGITLQTTTSGACIQVGANSTATVGASTVFGACAAQHILANPGAFIYLGGDYSITGGATYHWYANYAYLGRGGNRTITITGTPAFSSAFAGSSNNSMVSIFSYTFNGSATGKRYDAFNNGVINSNGAGATYLPGNVAGTTSTGGQYV